MDFFTKIGELAANYTLQLTVQMDSDEMIVMLVPKLDTSKENVQNKIKPLILRGKAEDIDVGFFPAITSGLRETGLLQSNVHEFEESLKQASKEAAGKKGSAAKEQPKKETTLFDQKETAEKPIEKKEEPVQEAPKSETPAPAPAGNVFKKKTPEPVKEEVKQEPEPEQQETVVDDFGDEDW